jgi:signal transduction histidine kinase
MRLRTRAALVASVSGGQPGHVMPAGTEPGYVLVRITESAVVAYAPSMGRLRIGVLSAAVVMMALIVAAATFTAANPSAGRVAMLVVAVLLAAISVGSGWAVLGVQPTATLGPILTLPGLIATIALAGQISQTRSSEHWPGSAYVTAASQGAWVLVYVAVAVPLLFFPHGQLETRADRWLLRIVVLDAILFIALAATAPGPYLPPNQTSPHVFGTLPSVVAHVGIALTLPTIPVTLIWLVVRLVRRRSSGSDRERRQWRWLSLIAAILPVTVLGSWLSYLIVGQANVVIAVGFTSMYVLLPLLIAVAVTRPHLFDVDQVLASTATHAILSAALLAVFTAVNVTVGLVTAQSAPVAATAATALCAVLILPLRSRLQRGIDRWLYPARKRVYVALDQLHADTVAGRARPEELQVLLQTALADPQLRVAYRIPNTATYADADGAVIDDDLTDATPVALGDEQIGAIAAGPLTFPELLTQVARHAAPLIEVVRLRVELNSALHEIEASRRRLLQVGYEERVRLERDLHDGAQQRLVSIGMALRLAQRRLPRGNLDVSGVLDEAVAELGTAVSELRRVAHGIRPACLDDGLLPALSDLVRSTPIPVRINVQTHALPDDLETTAYYVAAEAIANAIKHSQARHIDLDVDARGELLYVRIADDGLGGAHTRSGSGLAGLADRIGASGGSLQITSPPGLGTTVEAVLPCASS